jgi:crotonobetainyl-CoA:carnitine CoA-transferase CaiB-like acyl-CoA transferase
MVRMPAYGLSGPYSGWRALGTHVEGLIGHHHVRTYSGSSPDAGGDVFTADAAAGAHGALAAVMALRHRRSSGRGQLVELPLAEGFISFLGELILDLNMNGADEQWGNRHRSHAPHQAYPTAGEDAWIAIEARTDEEFASICRVLDYPELAADPRFTDAPARKANEDALDALLAERTRHLDKWDLFRRLQAEGVPAGPLQTAAERLACEQLAARSFFEELDSPSAGRFPYPGPIWRMEQTSNPLQRGPVTIGRDNEYVYRELLGLSSEEFADLVRREVIGTTYPARVLGRGD